MLAGQSTALDALVILAARLRVFPRHIFVDTAQPVNEPAHRWREPIVSGRKIGPEGVAAIGRYRHAAQNRGAGRVDGRRDVRVPARPQGHHHRLAVLVGGAVLGDRVDLGIPLDMAEYGMTDGRLAKLARHCDVLRMVEMLTTEEDDL